VALLRRHADTADEADQSQDDEAMRETRERILAKLERLRARNEAEAAEGIETKAALGRVEIIRWALRRHRGGAK